MANVNLPKAVAKGKGGFSCPTLDKGSLTQMYEIADQHPGAVQDVLYRLMGQLKTAMVILESLHHEGEIPPAVQTEIARLVEDWRR